MASRLNSQADESSPKRLIASTENSCLDKLSKSRRAHLTSVFVRSARRAALTWRGWGLVAACCSLEIYTAIEAPVVAIKENSLEEGPRGAVFQSCLTSPEAFAVPFLLPKCGLSVHQSQIKSEWLRGMVKNLPANAGDKGSILGAGRPPREGNGTPLQCSRLGNPIDSRAWQASVEEVAKEQDNNRKG